MKYKTGDYIKCTCETSCGAKGQIIEYNLYSQEYMILKFDKSKNTISFSRAIPMTEQEIQNLQMEWL